MSNYEDANDPQETHLGDCTDIFGMTAIESQGLADETKIGDFVGDNLVAVPTKVGGNTLIFFYFFN